MAEIKIERATAIRISLPMIAPFRTSFGEVRSKEIVLVKLFSDGLTGYGEAPCFHLPIYNSESIATCLHILKDAILPSVVGRSFSDVTSFTKGYQFLVGQKMARYAAEAAFWHLEAQVRGTSLKRLVGGEKDRIEVGHSVGIKESISETLSDVERALEIGYRRIKVKVQPGWDVRVLDAIRGEWPHIALTVDANAAYSIDRDLSTLLAFDSFNLEMIEQPLAPGDLVDHSTLQRLLRADICLDESIESKEDVRRAALLGACRIINLKPPRVGGVQESIAIHDIAQRLHLRLWCGGLLETGIGRAFNIAIASKPHFSLPNDMSRYDEFYAEDLVENSFTIDRGGTVEVPDSPGLGYTINEDAIRRFTVDECHILPH